MTASTIVDDIQYAEEYNSKEYHNGYCRVLFIRFLNHHYHYSHYAETHLQHPLKLLLHLVDTSSVVAVAFAEIISCWTSSVHMITHNTYARHTSIFMWLSAIVTCINGANNHCHCSTYWWDINKWSTALSQWCLRISSPRFALWSHPTDENGHWITTDWHSCQRNRREMV